MKREIKKNGEGGLGTLRVRAIMVGLVISFDGKNKNKYYHTCNRIYKKLSLCTECKFKEITIIIAQTMSYC